MNIYFKYIENTLLYYNQESTDQMQLLHFTYV